MKFLKRFVLVILLLVLALIGIGYVLPESAHVERSVRIDAPPETVFPYVNNFRKFNQWSPWAAKSSNTSYSFEGPESGVGARMFWEGEESEIGSGSNLITESRPPELVRTRLDFGGQGNATAFFDIAAANEGSRVTWGFDTEFGANIVARYFGLAMSYMVGGDYEQGLQNLKTLVESEQARPRDTGPAETEDQAGQQSE